MAGKFQFKCKNRKYVSYKIIMQKTYGLKDRPLVGI